MPVKAIALVPLALVQAVSQFAARAVDAGRVVHSIALIIRLKPDPTIQSTVRLPAPP
jgi:hypothetical protein